MAKEFNIRHTDGKTRKFTEGDNCKAMGTSGMTDGVEVEGTLTKGNFNEFCLINKRGIPCSVNDRTLVKVKPSPKKYYATEKRAKEYIDSVKNKFESYTEFLSECKAVIKDLDEYPNDNKNQLRFFRRVEKIVEARAIAEHLPK